MKRQTRTGIHEDYNMVSYNHLLKLSRSAIITLDEQLNIKDTTGATEMLMAQPAVDLIGTSYLLTIVPHYRTFVETSLQSTEPFEIEYPLGNGQDKMQWVRHYGDGVTNNGQAIYQFMVQAIDAPKNERIAYEHSLLNALPDMLVVIQQDGTITEFHSAPDVRALDIAPRIKGKSIFETGFPQPLLDETQLYLSLDLPAYVQAIEFAGDETDDNSEFFEARLVRLNSDEVMILIRNVTPMKQVQDDLNRHIEDLNLVKQVNIELSADLDVEYVAPLALDAALRMTNARAGYLAMREPSGDFKLMSYLGEYDETRLQQRLTARDGIPGRILKTNNPELILDVTQDDDYTAQLPDTRAMMAIPLLSKSTIVGILILEASTDDRLTRERFQFLQLITGRIAAFLDNAILHRQTREQYEEVRQLEQLKTDMIRIANHDLKNPIAGIMGYMELLRYDINEKLTENEQNYLDKIEVAARKMQRITTGILSLERIQQLSDQQNLKVINLRSLVNQSVSEQMDYAVRSQQTLHRHLPEDDVYIQGDPLQLHEALSNLVQNAIKYTDAQGEVNVSLDVIGDMAQVRVEDNGYGIPDNQKERMFEPFYRVKTRETRYIEGTGLGLHLVKNIIERHSGEMIFESVYGEGSIFGFKIPLLPSGMVG